MNKVKGEQLYVFIAPDGEFLPIGASTDCSLSLSAATVEVASKGQGKWRKFRASRKDWRISCSGFYLEQVGVPNSMLQGAKLQGENCRVAISVLAKELSNKGFDLGDISPDAVKTLVGDAIITECDYSGSNGSIATYSISFQGNGALLSIT